MSVISLKMLNRLHVAKTLLASVTHFTCFLGSLSSLTWSSIPGPSITWANISSAPPPLKVWLSVQITVFSKLADWQRRVTFKNLHFCLKKKKKENKNQGDFFPPQGVIHSQLTEIIVNWNHSPVGVCVCLFYC